MSLLTFLPLCLICKIGPFCDEREDSIVRTHPLCGNTGVFKDPQNAYTEMTPSFKLISHDKWSSRPIELVVARGCSMEAI